MNKLEKINQLISYLLENSPEYLPYCEQHSENYTHQRALLRGLMNIWNPEKKLAPAFYELQNDFLSAESQEKGIVSAMGLPSVSRNPRVSLWQGDITRLDADAIVNAANSQMLGCFIPCHSCIDNAIHSAAGIQLREECAQIMKKQGHEEPTGQAKITNAYNLPARHVIHTVGPIIYHSVTEKSKKLLTSCYQSCMALAEQYHLHSIAFCCISTGEFHFPNDQAAAIAVSTVIRYLDSHPSTSIQKVVFNVFKDIDLMEYRHLLK